MRITLQRNDVASAARTASGNSSDLAEHEGANARFLLSVTAVSGTSPTLNVKVEGKTLAGGYVTLASFAQATAATSESVIVTHLPNIYRISWTIGGTTPSFTFEVDTIIETA